MASPKLLEGRRPHTPSHIYDTAIADAVAQGWDAAMRHLASLPHGDVARLRRWGALRSDIAAQREAALIRREGALVRKEEELALWAEDMQRREDALRCDEIGASRRALQEARVLQVREDALKEREAQAVREAADTRKQLQMDVENMKIREELVERGESALLPRTDAELPKQGGGKRQKNKTNSGRQRREAAEVAAQRRAQKAAEVAAQRRTQMAAEVQTAAKVAAWRRAQTAAEVQTAAEAQTYWWREEAEMMLAHERTGKQKSRSSNEKEVVRQNTKAGRDTPERLHTHKVQSIEKDISRSRKLISMSSYWQLAA